MFFLQLLYALLLSSITSTTFCVRGFVIRYGGLTGGLVNFSHIGLMLIPRIFLINWLLYFLLLDILRVIVYILFRFDLCWLCWFSLWLYDYRIDSIWLDSLWLLGLGRAWCGIRLPCLDLWCGNRWRFDRRNLLWRISWLCFRTLLHTRLSLLIIRLRILNLNWYWVYDLRLLLLTGLWRVRLSEGKHH